MKEILITPRPINKENFSKFGDIITTKDIKPIDINNGYAKRYDVFKFAIPSYLFA